MTSPTTAAVSVTTGHHASFPLHGHVMPEISPSCTAKAGLLYRLGPGSAITVFFALLFIAFYFGVKMIIWAKGIPTLASERGRFEELNAALRRLEIDADPTLQPYPEPEKIYLSTHRWIYAPVPGNRFLKICKGFFAINVIAASHVMMDSCIRNVQYCPRPTVNSTTFSVVMTFVYLFRFIRAVSEVMSAIGCTCLLKLVVDPVLEGVGRREWGADVFFVQNFLFMNMSVFLFVVLLFLDFLMRACFLGDLFERIGGPPQNLYHINLVMGLWRMGCLRLGVRR